MEDATRFRIFLSWSGRTSRHVAESLREWLPNVLQYVEPWISTEDIQKGSRWASDVADTLQNTSFGILCVTVDNVSAPWLLFEAGALSKNVRDGRVCTYLLDLDPSQVPPPLGQFQATKANQDDTLKLVLTMNACAGGVAINPDRVRIAFEKWWPDLAARLEGSPVPHGDTGSVRSDNDLLTEILFLARETRRNVAPPVLPDGTELPPGSHALRIVRGDVDKEALEAMECQIHRRSALVHVAVDERSGCSAVTLTGGCCPRFFEAICAKLPPSA